LVDAGRQVGDYSQVRFFDLGEALIAYFDAGHGTLREAVQQLDQGGGGEPCDPCSPCDPCPILRSISHLRATPLHAGGVVSMTVVLGTKAAVDMELFDVSGRRVAHRGAQELKSGPNDVVWSPSIGAAGVYFLRVQVNGTEKLKSRV